MQKESTNLDQRFERCGLRKFEFKFNQYSPGHYEYTGKRIDEFGVMDLKIYLNENLI